jgi:hypothetical protein
MVARRDQRLREDLMPALSDAGFVFALAYLATLGLAVPAQGVARPDSYAEFDASVRPSDGKALKKLIESGERSAIYLLPGVYVLDNPVVVDRATSLFLHGADRMGTVLVASDPSKPLFRIERAPLVNFAGLRLAPTQSDPQAIDARAVLARTVEPLAFEMLDCVVDHSMLAFEGPGTYQIQVPMLEPGGRVRAAIWVDHPEADVLVFGGDASNGQERLRAAEFAFVWQRRGRVRVYGTTFEGNLGPGDVRLETRSTRGAHVIANVRSEGVNGALNRSGAVSRLLYVPGTAERVDVLLKGNGGAWDTGPLGDARAGLDCSIVSYGGAGTVWLLGNRADGRCGGHIAEGHAPEATIVSVANQISSPLAFPIEAKRIISASDLFNHFQWSGGDPTHPWVRWIPDGSPPRHLSSFSDVPRVPDDILPPALRRPRLAAALPGMLDVTAKPFLARGDGATDDTGAIQAALDAGCDGRTPKLLYFPAGTYRIRDTLYLNHHQSRCRAAFPYGGWIAGAGSRATTIEMLPGVKKGVLATDGLAAATVQGITFKTFPYRAGDPEQPNVDVEFRPGYLASQLNTFYDVVFDGGFAAFATGVKHPTGGQCSSNVVFGGELKNAHIGFVSGHFNALANAVVESRFSDNDYAMGSWTDTSNQAPPFPMPPGGTFFAHDSVSTGTRVQDFLFAGSASGSTWYFYGWNSDAPRYFESKPTAASWPLLFDRSRLAPRPGATFLFDVASSMGPFFLHSKVTRSAIRLGQTSMGASYAIRMQSEIPDWAGTVAPKPASLADGIDW